MTTLEGVRRRIDALADQLAATGELTDPRWRAALHAVPRHLFVPAIAWASPRDGTPDYRIDRNADPDAWWHAAYANHPIITRPGAGAAESADGTERFTSALPAPGVVMDFLEILDPYEHDEVLEIGTGAGWTTALLSSRVGARNVTTIEVDAEVAKRALMNLDAVGHAPTMIVGDAETLRPGGGPFDRLHVVCGVTTLPYSWIEQVRPGGVIVFPWTPEFEGGHKARLTVGRDGVATGRLWRGRAGFTMLRRRSTEIPPGLPDDARASDTPLDPRRVFHASAGADIAVAGLLPGLNAVTSTESDGTFQVRLWRDEAVAHVRYSPESTRSTVRQHGPADLWDEVEDAFFRWVSWSEPARERFGLSVTPEGQHVWLDFPDQVVSPLT